jgi:redox-regulated HSP33 family molecular chaperone
VSADVVEFLQQSEQKNCGINLSVAIDWDDTDRTKFKVTAALAYLVHILPQPTEQKMNEALLRWDRQMEALGPISKWGLRPECLTLDMLRLICGEEDPNVVMNQRVKFACKCNTDRAQRALMLLEAQEKKEGSFVANARTNIRCEYCGKTYMIQGGEAAAEKPTVSRQIGRKADLDSSTARARRDEGKSPKSKAPQKTKKTVKKGGKKR